MTLPISTDAAPEDDNKQAQKPTSGRACSSSTRRAIRKHQHPRQIDPIILSTFASSGSMAGLLSSSGPFVGPLPTPDDESAVPSELVPGAAALVPRAPPVTDV